MNTQPEALRLADLFEVADKATPGGNEGWLSAAAELRRLHTLNSELLWALVKVKESTVDGGRVNTLAREAIAKAEAQQ